MDLDEWIEWAVYNHVLGVPREDIEREMESNGISGDTALQALREALSSPACGAADQLARKVSHLSALNTALLELESQVVDFSKIPRVESLSSDTFHRDYYCTNRPVIVTDLVPEWPAAHKWSSDFFRVNFGAERIRFQIGRSKQDHRDSFVDHTVEAPFSEFLDSMQSPSVDSCPPYIIAHDHLLDRPAFQTLLNDIVFDSRYFDRENVARRVFFWMGPAGSATPMHRDLGNVYLAQIRGRKLIRMVPSRQLHLMYNDVGYHSEADFENLDLDAFPLLGDAFIIEETISPGELLFIPVGWWHYVKSLEETISITGNNFAFRNSLPPIFE
jgi:Cupin-like domain